MSPQELDVIVRVAGATLLIWAAISPRPRLSKVRWFFIPLALCLSGFLAGNTPDGSTQLSGPLGRLSVMLAGYAAVFLWWWCLAVFDNAFRPRGFVLAIGATWIMVASADRGLFGPTLEGKGLSWLLIGLGLAMVGHLAWRLLRDGAGDLIDRRRQARLAVVALLSAQLLADLAVDLVFGLDWGPRAVTILQNSTLLAFTGWLLSLDPGWEAPDRTAARQQPVQTEANAVLAARLRALMETDRVYLDPELSFDTFVRAMGAPERVVRRLINHELGHDHFKTFLNTYRVDEARRRLSAPERRNEKLIAIAMDSGFASLPSFNRVFRDMQGCTPSTFRAAALSNGDDEMSSQSSEKLSAEF